MQHCVSGTTHNKRSDKSTLGFTCMRHLFQSSCRQGDDQPVFSGGGTNDVPNEGKIHAF